MASPRVLVLRSPGTNCDQETAFAFEQAGATVDLVHINRLLDDSHAIGNYQVMCLPGGFSYGDDIAAGRILANQIRHHLTDAIQQLREKGSLVLGICNGFQVLIKSGLLVDDLPAQPAATLTWNDSGKFEDRWVQLKTEGDRCVFLQGIESIYLPVAHAEGKFVTRDASMLKTLASAGQLSLRYASQNGRPDPAYPDNPNGSQMDVAGMCDSTGRVFGLMPHPERFIDPVQHPRWTRGEAGEVGDGLQLFKNAVNYFN